MKKITLLAGAFAFALFSCNSDKNQEKLLLDSVMKAHDKVMADDAAIMTKKIQLKSIAAIDTIASVKDSVAAYTKLLNNADDVMMGWMNKFNPVFSGKSHQEIMDYLTKQKADLVNISLKLDSAITASGNYISKNKK